MKKHIFLSIVLLLAVTVCGIAQQTVKHILLEEFSTAPCGFCPDGDLVAAQIIKDYPSVIWVTHHAGFGTDSMTVQASIPIAGAFTTFAPGACIDRGDYQIPVYTMPPYIAVSRQKWDSVVVAHLNDPPVAGLTLTNSYDSVSRTLDCMVDISFVTAPVPGDIRLNLWLMEDSVTGFGPGYDQINYYNTSVGHPYYGAGNPIVGYVHRHVLRHAEGGSWGLQGIVPSAPAAGSQYTHAFTGIPVPAGWKDDDIDVIAFLSYYDPNASLRPVINAGHKKLKNVSVSGLPDVQDLPLVSVMPNPASDFITVRNEGARGHGVFTLSATDGKTVCHMQIPDGRLAHSIPVTDLENGLYFFSFSNGTVRYSGKVAVQH